MKTKRRIRMTRILFHGWEFFKVNFKWLILAMLFLYFYGKGCFQKPEFGQNITINNDTTKTQVPQPIVVMPEQKPQQTTINYPSQVPQHYAPTVPASTFDELVSQVTTLNGKIEELSMELYAMRTYNDSIILKDTAGTRVGIVNLEQGVSENKLKYTRPSYQLSFPLTRITTTITKKESPKNQVYAGVGFSVPIKSLSIQGVEGGLLFKNKRDNILGLSGLYNLQNRETSVRLSIFKKIKL
jgi:hypothetical protein